MNRIQKKLMEYHHGYFLAIGFLAAAAGMVAHVHLSGFASFTWVEAATVIGALVLGYGTGRCDQKACAA